MIYPDKFLYANKSKDYEMDEEVQRLKDKQKQIRNKIQQYKEFYKGNSLLELMDVTKNFIESQGEDFLEIDYNGENIEEEEKSPTKIGKLGIKQ